MRTHSWPEGHWDWPIKVTHKHALRCGSMIFVGGQVDLDSAGGVLQPGDRQAQIRRVMLHLDTVLTDLTADLTDVVKLQVFYVANPPVTEEAILALIAAELPASAQPTVTLIPLPYLGYPGMMVEIEATAMSAGSGVVLPRRVANPPEVPALPAPFVHGLACGAMIFLSGQAPLAGTDDIVAQSGLVMDRIDAILSALDSGLADMVKLNRWYVGQGALVDWAPAALAVASRFAEPGPAATGMPLPRFADPRQRIMIDGVAMRGPKRHAWPPGHWDWPLHLPYRHGVLCGDMVFIGGQVALTPQGEVIDPGAMAAQTHVSLAYIERVLAEFGLPMDAVVKVLTLYSAAGRPEELHTNLAIRSAAFTEPGPATTGIPLPCLAYSGMMIEIEIIAMTA